MREITKYIKMPITQLIPVIPKLEANYLSPHLRYVWGVGGGSIMFHQGLS